MRRPLVLTALAMLAASLLWAHDLFIKLDTYFLEPHASVRIPVLNGTFETSENSIARTRLLDVSLVSAAGRLHLDTLQWVPQGDTTFVDVTTGAAGTYVLGASTKPQIIALEAEDFNAYLEEDGIPDILARRQARDELGQPARERYHKHPKAVFQVGDRLTDAYQTVLGYPAEIVPVTNPYALAVPARLEVRCLVSGQPVANQLVVMGGERDGTTLPKRTARTGADGIVGFAIEAPGTYWMQFIHMTPQAGDSVDYESRWGSLTFEVAATPGPAR